MAWGSNPLRGRHRCQQSSSELQNGDHKASPRRKRAAGQNILSSRNPESGGSGQPNFKYRTSETKNRIFQISSEFSSWWLYPCGNLGQCVDSYINILVIHINISCQSRIWSLPPCPPHLAMPNFDYFLKNWVRALPRDVELCVHILFTSPPFPASFPAPSPQRVLAIACHLRPGPRSPW